ncbi:predicted protein [Streptomyces sp. AA4]|nr:predicted protein [Streptomyces sp. AA4]
MDRRRTASSDRSQPPRCGVPNRADRPLPTTHPTGTQRIAARQRPDQSEPPRRDMPGRANRPRRQHIPPGTQQTAAGQSDLIEANLPAATCPTERNALADNASRRKTVGRPPDSMV